MATKPTTRNMAIRPEDEQPTRRGTAETTRTFDQTFLDPGSEVIHRDILSHALRWKNAGGEEPTELICSWAAGLVDGEGCFSLTVNDRSDTGTSQVQWVFSIEIRVDDRPVLEKLKKLLGVGNISEQTNSRVTNAKPVAILGVSSRADIQVIVDFFRSWPLRSKKANDFGWWAEAFEYFQDKYSIERNVKNQHIAPEDMKKLAWYAQQLAEGRTYPATDYVNAADRYIKHVIKYGFSKRKFIEHEKSRVLDVGCGPDKPLFSILFGGIGGGDGGFPKTYTAVDLNSVKPTRHKRSKIYPNTNIFEAWEQIRNERGPFDLITNFEVIEHMPFDKGLELLCVFRELLAPGGKVLLSTPVYDGIARAKNHIREYTIPELQQHFEDAGFVVLERFGTFMNMNDLKRVASKEERAVFEKLRGWWGNDMLSNIFASLHPDEARNNFWVAQRRPDLDV